ncbi:hypothetical protein C355_05014 [Cryptococcus neoformans Th84]|nr:hypothetical protein C355_05014 [Cryptococcus neoformans var. grubii Th84]OXH47784.1 hypothetical protein J003_04918 [Cryptococcus neoformans var. grubii]OXH67155.1 hypothetical protein J000_04992 [Cryptococcus neoformans var. grubii]
MVSPTRMRSPALPLALLAPLLLPAAAFRDTSPLLIWNSHQSPQFHHASPSLASSALADAGDVYRKLDILGCDWETAVAVHIDDLHASCTSDYGIPSDAHVHIPYLSRPNKRSLDDSLDAWADKCGAAVVDDLADVDGKRLVKLSIAKGESIPSLASPSILLITGSRSSSKPEKRQERPFPTYTSTSSLTTRPTPSSPKHNSTIPTDAPLFDRVQILTTPIITALLVTFGLFIPLAAFGISALASIQVPPRMMEIGKGLVVGKERKDQ